MRLDINSIYSTCDISLATAINLFYPIWAIDRKNPNKAEFIFKREDGLDDLIQQYWSKTLKVSPLTYFQQLKILKSRLYEHE